MVVLAAYLLLWPAPIQPVSLPVPVQPGYVGVHAVNTKLANLQVIDLNGEVGPEHIAFGSDGTLYTTVASGTILRMNADGTDQHVFANTGGYVLGFDFDSHGNVVAADAKITVLTDSVNGDPIRYADAVVIAKNGKMYLSDASTRFAPKDWGVALSQDEQSLFVNETGRYRVWKIAVGANDLDVRTLAAQSNPQATVFMDNLSDKPWLRELTLRLPRMFWPVPKSYGHVIAFTEDGEIVADLQDPTVCAEPACTWAGLVAE